MNKQNLVYHSSNTRGLSKLEPRVSTHEEPWLYATRDLATSVLFIGCSSDLICQIGTSLDGVPHIYERFEGALEYGYSKQSGSVYVLDGSTFREGMTSFSGEVISEVSVDVIEEIYIDDALEFLLKLEEEGRLLIYRYPNTPPNVVDPKEGIVERAVEWASGPEGQVVKDIREFHPDLLEEVRLKLKEKGIDIGEGELQENES